MTFTRRPSAASTAVALVLSAVAAQAEEPKQLFIYNWSDYIAEDTIANFEAETGIDVTYDVFDSNEVLEAKLLAGSSGYDLVVPSATFMARQIQAGVFMPLDKAKLPNLANLDPAMMETVAANDPGNEHGVIYMWGTTGIGINVEMVAERLGEEIPRSWDLVLDPEIAAKLADCGITWLDSAAEVMGPVLNAIGRDPTSKATEDFEAAAEAIMAVRPHIRYFHSSQYVNDLANGDVCVSVGWSGDVFIARDRAAEADNGVTVDYVIPVEGTMTWFDMMGIPADAPHPENAHLFLDYLMRPEVTAGITNYVWYANANTASLEMVDPEITADPAIFPPQDVKDKLFPAVVYGPREDRVLNRLWTEIKTGR
ncbi:MAG: polyamine ABC transporter substrate-binding protein [Pseudomonadota bacterium]